MKLEQMFHNVLNYSLEALTIKVSEDSMVREMRLAESTSKNYVDSTKARSSAPKLSDQEKAILKALGLSMKDVKALAMGGGNG